MTYNILGILFIMLLCGSLRAQVLPAEGSTLSYRVIGFAIQGAGTGKYRLDIAPGDYNNTDSFEKHIIKRIERDSCRIIAEVPSFGSAYTWRMLPLTTGAAGTILHHFSITALPDADTSRLRLRIIEQAKAYKGGYVFLDGNRALYDMNGNPVWMLPDKENFRNERMELRDLKMTPQGTITFLLVDKAYEISYRGDILWRGPDKGTVSGDTSEHYHHELTRLQNGNYMVLGMEYMLWRYTTKGRDSSWTFVPYTRQRKDSFNIYHFAPLGTIIEYDHNNNVVWSWKSSSYVAGSDIFYHLTRDIPDAAIHQNAFSFDEQNKVIYTGFRNVSRILKIKYPEGKVLATYGETYKHGMPEKGNGLFCRQHCSALSQQGYLYLFNNNNCNPESTPTLLMMQQPGTKGGTLKKVWEYDCPIEGVSSKKQRLYQFPTGGNMLELPDKSIFACMGGTYSKVMILNRDKKVLWSALPEKWNEAEKKWKIMYSYRASMVTGPEEMARLVWGTAR